MLKRIISIVLVLVMALSLTACFKTRIVHCDNCNEEITVRENNQMTEDWLIYCETCNEELFGDDPLLGTGN